MPRFNVGADKPIIDIVYKATIPIPVSLQKLAATLQQQISRDLKPAWGVDCKLRISKNISNNNWGLVFLDNATQANTLGYHDLTTNGFPIGRVFVKTTLKDGGDVAVTASHELMEMLVDPSVNLTVFREADSTIYAYEVSDAVEETTYRINNVNVSNFMFPTWFEEFRAPNSTAFDFLGKTIQPFQILKGGYMPVIRKGQWTEIFASKEKAARFKKEDREGHRSERRKKKFNKILKENGFLLKK